MTRALAAKAAGRLRRARTARRFLQQHRRTAPLVPTPPPPGRSRRPSPPPTARSRSRRVPRAIVSLSPTATEMLYAIGAGSQVKAVDKYSDYPRNAPRTTLDDLSPNVEAIVSYRPDLVVVPGDSTGLTARLKTFGIPVLSLPPADDARRRLRAVRPARPGHRPRPGGAERGGPREGADRPDRARRAEVQRGADLLLRARPDLLLGDVVDLHRQGASACSACATSPTAPRRRRRAAATRSCRRSSSCSPTPTGSSWPTPSAAGRVPAPWRHAPGGRRCRRSRRDRWSGSTTTSPRGGGHASSTCSRRWRPPSKKHPAAVSTTLPRHEVAPLSPACRTRGGRSRRCARSRRAVP